MVSMIMVKLFYSKFEMPQMCMKLLDASIFIWCLQGAACALVGINRQIYIMPYSVLESVV